MKQLDRASTAGEAVRTLPISRRGMLIGAGGSAAGMALAGLWHPAAALAAGNEAGKTVLSFSTMAAVTGAFVGASGTPIRGIHGGGLPWKLDDADGKLRADGRLHVRVRGLVLAGGPPSIIGTNPIPMFRAIVSFANHALIFTGPVPASKTGNAEIETHIDLPHPGFAPVIFIGPSATPGAAPVWFAVTGTM